MDEPESTHTPHTDLTDGRRPTRTYRPKQMNSIFVALKMISIIQR